MIMILMMLYVDNERREKREERREERGEVRTKNDFHDDRLKGKRNRCSKVIGRKMRMIIRKNKRMIMIRK